MSAPQRRHRAGVLGDNRSAFQRDRDRIIYTSAYRRLAGVTQVVSALEGHVFHNRLTHTMKVAQVARRLAEKLATREHVEAGVPLDADVAEAAAHAHDIGHPPFGHVVEVELQRLMEKVCGADHFEGNAQSFRVVTKISRSARKQEGLDLTDRTLDAILKYPWQQETSGDPLRKWGAYVEETEDFRFARGHRANTKVPSLEARVMDWADDITYAVHDVEDLFRAGLVPLERFTAEEDDAREDFAGWLEERWQKAGDTRYSAKDIQQALKNAFAPLPISEPYQGRNRDRELLRTFTSTLIRGCVNETTLREGANGWELAIRDEEALVIRALKELTWRYVIERPALAGQQHGQKAVVRYVYETFMDASNESHPADLNLLPVRALEALDARRSGGGVTDRDRARIVCDAICMMTEDEILRLHARLTGASLGSVLDAIV